MASSSSASSASSSSGLNLKALQAGVLHRLLRLHGRVDGSDGLSAASSDSSSSSSWKLLIYDRYCQDILSPLLTVNELRSLGITLHMSLHASRERVPDVPAVYFVRPTAENLALIARDVRAGIYDATHINFSSSVPSAMLESFAQMVMQPTKGVSSAPARALHSGAASAQRIVRIMDQYAEFVSLEDRLFTLNHAESFARLNGASDAAGEADMFAHVEEMVTALFGVCVTMGAVPIIRAKAGHAAELVASKLDARLREHLASRNNLFAAGAASTFGFHRPLLVLVDRNFDLAAPLLHSWTYQALLHDVMAMSSNRVTVQVTDQAGTPHEKTGPKTYDLLSGEDKFWKHHAGKVFPKVAEGVTERLQALQIEHDAVKKKAGVAAAGGAATLTAGSDDLADAINALPKLDRRKKLLGTHMNIATALLKEIKARDVDTFYDIEQNLLQKQSVDKQSIASIFGGAAAPAESQTGKGTITDRIRFLIVHYLTGGVTDDQLAQYRQLLQDTSATSSSGPVGATDAAAVVQSELAAIDYVQQFKALHRISGGDEFGAGASSVSAKPTPAPSGMLGNFSKLADSLYGGGVGLLANVRNLLPSNNHLPLTRLVDQLMANRDGGDALDATYKYFDPKSSGRGRVTKVTAPFKEAVVFVLGGGTYNEYQNLQDWQRESSQSHGVASVVYGCSEIVAPDNFLRQLAQMQRTASRAHVPVD